MEAAGTPRSPSFSQRNEEFRLSRAAGKGSTQKVLARTARPLLFRFTEEAAPPRKSSRTTPPHRSPALGRRPPPPGRSLRRRSVRSTARVAPEAVTPLAFRTSQQLLRLRPFPPSFLSLRSPGSHIRSKTPDSSERDAFAPLLEPSGLETKQRRDNNMTEQKKMVLFSDDVRVTAGAAEALQRAGENEDPFISRHLCGDWGEADDETCYFNRQKLHSNFFSDVLSVFHTRLGETIHVSTSWKNAQGGSTIVYIPEA